MKKQGVKKALLEMGYRAINDNGELKVLERLKNNLKMIDRTFDDIVSIEKIPNGYRIYIQYSGELVDIDSNFSVRDDIEEIRDWIEWGSINYR